MLYGYFLVLSIPLIVVVPFSAFRSLAAEREDGTFELISITALARQIVGGKLGSAILQMLVYFSALALAWRLPICCTASMCSAFSSCCTTPS